MVEDLWYKNTLIYSLDLETFMDADGDGVGDFEGLMRRLDYPHSLGVGTLWLAPFHPSPNRDNGYDIDIISNSKLMATAGIASAASITSSAVKKCEIESV